MIEREPDWSKLPPNVSPRIHELLQRCLEKDPKKRKRDAGDLRIDIEQALTEPERVGQPTGPALSRRRERLGWIAAALAIVIAIGAIVAVPYLRVSAELPEMRTDIVTPPTPDPLSFAISPDGRLLVFVVAGQEQPQLWLRQLDAIVAQPLAGTEGARLPFWSPDSRSVGFFAAGKLKRIDVGGGPPQTLVDAAPGWGGSWSSDNVILFASTIIARSCACQLLAARLCR